MNQKRRVNGWFHGWMPKEPLHMNAADYLGFSLVYKVLTGAAAAGLAGALGNLVLKVPWKKTRETWKE
jgi:hypothetical protein